MATKGGHSTSQHNFFLVEFIATINKVSTILATIRRAINKKVDIVQTQYRERERLEGKPLTDSSKWWALRAEKIQEGMDLTLGSICSASEKVAISPLAFKLSH